MGIFLRREGTPSGSESHADLRQVKIVGLDGVRVGRESKMGSNSRHRGGGCAETLGCVIILP